MENPRQETGTSETVQQRIGRRLQHERLRHNLSQEELAEQVGVNVRTVRRWERGAILPQPHYREQLCQLFHLTASILFELENEQQADPPEKRSVWYLPFPHNPHFTGRDELLGQLAQHFAEEKAGEQRAASCVALTQPQAIKGLGGIGKTQIAVEYAYRAREQGRYTHILWINAASEEAIITSFLAIAELLPAFSEQKQTDQTKLVAAIKRWLEQCQEPWLLAFDNADDLTLTQQYFPTLGHGSILLTTRANAVGALAASVEVEKMGLVEGTQLLLLRAQRLHATDEERHEAMNVVIALDSFPLALDQAGAYIEETGCRFSTYLQLYQDHRQVLLARRGVQATSYPDSVATTWALSFKRIEQANPAAAELLHLCAYLSPDHIPEELLREGAAHWPPLLQQACLDSFQFEHAIEVLLTFSLVKRLTEEQTVSLHRLVQAVQVDAMEPEEQRQWAERVVRGVHLVFPPDPKEDVACWPQCLRYLEQAQACDTLIQQYHLPLPEAAELLTRAAIYLNEHASYDLAKSLYQRALALWEHLEPPEHSSLATACHGLGKLYLNQGNYQQAEHFYQRAIAIRERQLGPDHADLASPLTGLANIYFDQRKFEQAEYLYRRAIAIREQQLGPDDPLVSVPLNNLADLCREQGRYEEAEALFLRALRLCKQQSGSLHPNLVHTLQNLAVLYDVQGRYAQAEALYLDALQIWEQQLGFDHPQVAYPLNNLAEMYRAQGRYAEAEPLYQRALSIWEQQMGSEHHAVAYALNGLANLYREQGKYTKAEPLFQRALHIREQQLSPEHPDTAETLHDLAIFRERQGNRQEACALYQRALTIREQALGSAHSQTRETRTCLITLLHAMGQHEEAARLEMTT